MLLALCTVYGIAFITPQVPFEDVVNEDGSTERIIKSHGYEHDKFPSMEQGGPGAERHAKTLWVGWAISIAFILLWAALLMFAASRDGKLGPAKVPLIVGSVLFMGLFTAVIFSYRAYMTEETHSLFLSLPKPVAWMVYGIWPFPLYFVAVYYFIFDRWYFTDEEQRRFDEIVANYRQATSEDH